MVGGCKEMKLCWLCYMDGRFLPAEEARLPVTDLIIQRGIGVFEVIATYRGRPLMLTSHLERLMASAASSRIRPPLTMEKMKEIVREGIALALPDVEDELQVKVYLSGGDAFDSEKGFTAPRFFVIFEELSLPPQGLYERGAVLEPVPAGRDNPTVKSVDYRTSYSLSRRNALEVLYCPGGEITESAHSSFFLVLGGVLITAPLSRVLNGTARAAVIELARLDGLTVEERPPLLSELPRAEEAFITGSVKKVMPVTQIGDQIIGDGRPGPVTLRLSELYLRRLDEWLE